MERLAVLLPGVPTSAAARSHICVRPVPFDGLPIVGALPGIPGAYVLSSHSGVTLAPLLGEQLADEIDTGRRSPWLAPYGVERVAVHN